MFRHLFCLSLEFEHFESIKFCRLKKIFFSLTVLAFKQVLLFFGVRWIFRLRLRLMSARFSLQLSEKLLIDQINVGLRKLRISCQRFINLWISIVVSTFMKLHHIQHIDVVFVIWRLLYAFCRGFMLILGLLRYWGLAYSLTCFLSCQAPLSWFKVIYSVN